ncbi:hypothetical protein R1flu_000951 [Riccia fluitans]|uniref:DCD domain-containing protein n=1 Tax=Riccia fluitans TaxID=41844 RepID=A0ABD1Y289_9MARC
MVATKRIPQPEVKNAKENRSGSTEAGSVFQEPLGGFIFVCNNETMDEDFERHLFGLPQRYHDSVKAIQPGLPLFLYNYTTRCLHGVFEASSDGGLNIEPDAWGENKDSRKNGRQSVSRFPAQVRVRMREHRPPLEEERFRPVLYHYDGPKFRLQLSQSEAQELLKLFGVSQGRKVIEDLPDDTGGEWERVKTKSKASRNYRVPPAKRSSSPSANGGRRRGSAQSGLNGNGNGNGSLSTFSSFMHETVSRGRDRDNRVDSAHRWRSDSDSWSGSSSAGTATSSWGSNEEERPKKELRGNGCVVETNGVGSEGHDCVDGIASKGLAQTNGHYDSDSKVDARFLDSNESNGSSSSLSAEARAAAAARSGFVSYSAALKSGMLAGAAVENGFGDGNGSSVCETGNSLQNSVGNGTSRATIGTAASAGCISSSSPRANSKAEFSLDRIEQSSKQTTESSRPVFQLNIGSYSEAAGSGSQAKSGSQNSVDKGGSESRAENLSKGGENEGRKAGKTQPWGKPLVVKAVNLADVVSGQQSGVLNNHVSGSKATSDHAPLAKSFGKDMSRSVVADTENSENGVHHKFGSFEIKEIPAKPVETVVRKNVWQGNEGAVLRLLHDPDPAVNSGSMNGGTSGQRIESDTYRGKHDRVKSPQPHAQHLNPHASMERVYMPSPPLEGQLTHWPDQSSSPSGVVPSHIPHSKVNQQQGPMFHQNRSSHESRRHQYDNQKHDKHMDDRVHFRKQHMHPSEHHQHPTSMMHSQQRQFGQGLMPLRIPTPPPGMQQLHHHAILSPAPLYRDRSRARGGNGNSENGHGMAYRPISRNMVDGDIGLQSPMGLGGWTVQSPVLLMQPMLTPLNISGNFSFSLPPPHLLTNVEALHAEILEFAQASRPSAETRVHAEAAVECVRDGVKKLWPDADVEVFGSFATGLCLQNSDVDVVVVDAPTPPDTPEIASLSGARLLCPLIRALSTSLKEREWCEAINTIETASMPVIKLRCRPVKGNGFSSEPPVAIDVTIGGRRSENFAGVSQSNSRKDSAGSKHVNLAFEVARNAHNGAAAREFVIEKLRQLPALAPLVLLMKSFLQHRGLNDVYSGGLGSFALTLMLVFYLERVPISCGVSQDFPPTPPVKSPPSVANLESSPQSVDTSRAASAVAEFVPICGLPQEVPTLFAKSPSSLENLEASSLSVDTSHAAPAVAESVASSDGDSVDSSVLTTTSVSSVASLEMTSVQGSTCGGDDVTSQSGPSAGQLLLRRYGGMVEELLASMQSVSSPNLGTLLVGFLHVFGHEIDFSRVRLVLKGKNGSPGGLFCHEKMARTLPLSIDDPLRPDAIIGAGSFNIWQVQASMREMLYSVTRPLSVPGTPVSGTPVDASDRNGKGPGRRRPLPLLDQVFFPNNPPLVP